MTNATSHNGGKVQYNFNALQTGGDYPFINHVKTGQFWSRTSGNAPVTPDILDANGYPTSLPVSLSTVFYIPTARDRPSVNGNKYVITWTGNGTIATNFQNTSVSGSKTGSGGFGRYVFTTTDFRIDLRITALSVTDLAFYHIDDETDYLAGEVFSSYFKQRILDGNVGVLRFLNWQLSNISNMTNWSSRKPVGYALYHDYELRSSLYATGMTNTGNAYVTSGTPSIHSSDGTVWNAGDQPKDKDLIHVLFNVSATQSGLCSMDIGNTGTPINILSEFATALNAGANTYPIGGTFESLGTLFYDAEIGAYIKMGGSTALASQGIANGVPLELCLRLCAEVGAHPHFIVAAKSLTPMSDFVTQFATYCKNNQPSWMRVRYEGPNELWNTGGQPGFLQTFYANRKATFYGWGNDYHNWYGRVMSTIGQDLYTVYANDTTKFALLAGVQTSTGDTSGNRANSVPRLNSTLYVGQTPQSGYTATAAKNYITHLCVAMYVTPTQYGTATETTMGVSYAAKQFVGSISGTTLTITDISSNLPFPFAVGDYIYGNSAFQNGAGTTTNTKITAFTSQTTPQTITGITQANPAVVTITTPPADGTKIFIKNASANGMTQLADGWYTARNPSGATFQLYSFGNSAVNSSAYSAYSGSGATAAAVGTFTINNSQTVASGQMTAASDPTQLGSYAATLLGGGPGSFSISAVSTLYQNWKTWLNGFGTYTLTAYEGGHSPDTGNGATAATDRLRVASKEAPRLVEYTLKNLYNFKAAGGEFPTGGYNFSGNADINNRPLDAWSVLNGVYQPDPPQWTAGKLYQSNKRRMLIRF